MRFRFRFQFSVWDLLDTLARAPSKALGNVLVKALARPFAKAMARGLGQGLGQGQARPGETQKNLDFPHNPIICNFLVLQICSFCSPIFCFSTSFQSPVLPLHAPIVGRLTAHDLSMERGFF